MRVLAPVELAIEANTLGHSLPTLARRHLGRADGRGLRRLQRVRGPRRHGKSRSPSSPITPPATRSSASPPSWARRVRDDELGPSGEHRRAVRLGEARVGQSDARDLQDRDGDAALHRHRPHRRPEAARDAEGRPGARVVPRQCRERLAAGADHDRRVQGPQRRLRRGRRAPDSWPGPQATDNAAGNACIMELARVFSSNPRQAPARPRLRVLDRPRDRHDDRLVLVSSIATGTGCASMRSPTCRSTSRLAPARAAGAPPRTSS